MPSSLFPRARIESQEKPSFRLWPSRFRKVARPPSDLLVQKKQRGAHTKRRNTLIPKKAHDVQTVTKEVEETRQANTEPERNARTHSHIPRRVSDLKSDKPSGFAPFIWHSTRTTNHSQCVCSWFAFSRNGIWARHRQVRLFTDGHEVSWSCFVHFLYDELVVAARGEASFTGEVSWNGTCRECHCSCLCSFSRLFSANLL